ncbi:DNA repair protein RadA [Candidatus Megaera venefica]|uniref:DNA repair protein RadA n=1 Tax=Candidatus Megaera venefica TaxID=2055910 RepID=A0ABU5NAE1_9RICK|nr:DNA repair protein RadA [Candidatus Megaera venefica]MEA0970138.1 DNA repair protein RadA [Candidatus Megaera venefica]
MTKNKSTYSCTSCGSVTSKWIGQCPECLEWGTVIEESVSASKIIVPKTGSVQEIHTLADKIESTIRTKTPIEELNRVLGGGLVAGSAILIGGDPGIGKSTLLLQLCTSLASSDIGCLYITGEESTNQIKLRAQRLGIHDNKTGLLAATNVEDIISTIDQNKKQLSVVVIDSIQTIASSEFSSAPGTVSQIRACAHQLIHYAKQNNITLLLACHVNKDGQLAGPKVLEHMVDTVLYFEGDHNNHFRILRSIKNRFGGVNEIGVFEMTSHGLVEISNPSELFLMERENNVSGSAVFAGIEGSRPLLIEIQALIAPTNMATPRRSVVGWDNNRLSMIIAVLGVRFGLNLSSHEVYLSVAGGLRITEPAADLAVAAALISAASNKPLPQGSIFFGEVGLSGEVRKVAQTEARIKEATKLGFISMYCSSKQKFNGLQPIMHLKQLKGLV